MKTNKPMNRLSVRMTKDLAARLRRIAKAEGKPVSAVVRDAMQARPLGLPGGRFARPRTMQHLADLQSVVNQRLIYT